MLIGYLAGKSGYVPRVLGVLLAVAGGGYLVDSFSGAADRVPGEGEGGAGPVSRDAVLNLPPRRYSWPLQQLAALSARDGRTGWLRSSCRPRPGSRSGSGSWRRSRPRPRLTWPPFYAGPALAGQRQPPGQPEEGKTLPAGLSADGKGVAMRPESRRTRTTAPGKRVKNFSTRPGIGEKGHKRIAEVACVFDVIPQPRTPEQVMASHHGGGDGGSGSGDKTAKPAPKAVSRRYAADIAADRSAAISWLFDEGERRDPGHARDWIALADGDNHQINLMEAEAAARGVTGLTILIDLVHVLEYLRKAAWVFHQPRDSAIETWTITQATDILHGRAAEVTDRIARLAAEHPPQGLEHAKNISRVLSYLRAKQPYLDYPKALAAGWPVATGVIEGACRHLVKDRMGITGARWSTDGAQAILWLRVIHANHDEDEYWNHHIQQEHQRNHLSRYAGNLTLAV